MDSHKWVILKSDLEQGEEKEEEEEEEESMLPDKKPDDETLTGVKATSEDGFWNLWVEGESEERHNRSMFSETTEFGNELIEAIASWPLVSSSLNVSESAHM